ncbi:unnamed protein product [Cladocopium goreaui]|uniref:Ammonium transporter AmtB-like domain-containing protein n=1 Tax=Cladocopium goreaui TaxID=2562237 RepID=A0A9P1GLI3_9DINO|nr:unnamed protein product [Cladocopium goreaui]
MNIVQIIDYGLVGDSSLYAKRPNKKRTHVTTELQYVIPGTLEVHPYPGGGINEIRSFLRGSAARGKAYQVLGISYFGNEHTASPMNEQVFHEAWQDLYDLLGSGIVLDRVVFFMGGYSAKYGYSQVYDDNMETIRRWTRDAGFEVRTDFEKVAEWRLSADNLHWDVEMNRDLADYWCRLLLNARQDPVDIGPPPPAPAPPIFTPPVYVATPRLDAPSPVAATSVSGEGNGIPWWMTQDFPPEPVPVKPVKRVQDSSPVILNSTGPTTPHSAAPLASFLAQSAAQSEEPFLRRSPPVTPRSGGAFAPAQPVQEPFLRRSSPPVTPRSGGAFAPAPPVQEPFLRRSSPPPVQSMEEPQAATPRSPRATTPAVTQPAQAPVLHRRISSPSPKPRRAAWATGQVPMSPREETQAGSKRIACSNASCDFLVSDFKKMGSFCCKKCHVHYSGGSKMLKHGPLCQQRLAAPWDQRLSQPLAPPEASVSSAESTAGRASTAESIPRFGATDLTDATVTGPASCASEKVTLDRKSFGVKWGLQLAIWRETGVFTVLQVRQFSPVEEWNCVVPLPEYRIQKDDELLLVNGVAPGSDYWEVFNEKENYVELVFRRAKISSSESSA